MSTDAAEIWQTIRDLINKVIPIMVDVDIAPDTPWTDLGISSIEMITVVFEVEEAYDVIIVDAGLDVFDTGAELVAVVQKLVGKAA